jgi:hypothetical protein
MERLWLSSAGQRVALVPPADDTVHHGVLRGNDTKRPSVHESGAFSLGTVP